MLLTSFWLFQPPDQAIRQPGDTASDSREQLPRDRSTHAVERAAMDCPCLALHHLPEKTTTTPKKPPYLNMPNQGYG